MRLRPLNALMSLIVYLVVTCIGCEKKHEAQEQETSKAYAVNGIQLAKDGKVTEAVVAFNRGIALDPRDPEPYIGLAVLYESVDRPDLSIEALEQLNAVNPTAAGLSCRLAEAYLGADDLPNARDWGAKAVKEAYDPARAHSVYGITLLRFRTWDTAAMHLNEAWKLAPGDVEIPLSLMEGLIQKGDYQAASAVGEKAEPTAPNSAPLHYKLGWAYCRLPQRGDTTERSITHLKKAAELAPRWFEPLAELGRLYLSLGKREDALSCFEKAWELNPQVAGVANNLANLLQQKGDKRGVEIKAAFKRLMKEREQFTALRREYNSPRNSERKENTLTLAAQEGRAKLFGTALHRLRKLLSEAPASRNALALYIRLDQEARSKFPDYLRPGPGISAAGL